jgi:hypothetical protein
VVGDAVGTLVLGRRDGEIDGDVVVVVTNVGERVGPFEGPTDGGEVGVDDGGRVGDADVMAAEGLAVGETVEPQFASLSSKSLEQSGSESQKKVAGTHSPLPHER